LLKKLHKINTSKIISIILLIVFTFLSLLALILRTYEYKIAFSLLDELKLKKELLTSNTNLYIEQIEEDRNQISIRKIATTNLGMITPNKNEVRIVSSTNHE
jgi:cell division protein FtsL